VAFIAPSTGDERGLRLEQVVHGLHEEQVAATVEQPAGLDLVRVTEVGEGDVAEARELRARPDRPGDVPGAPVAGLPVARDLAGDAGGGEVDVVRLLGMAYSFSTIENAPNVAVSMASTPTA
jgi:hypothetical protein